MVLYRLARRRPELAKQQIVALAARAARPRRRRAPPFHAELQALGPAHLRGAGRRPVQGAARGQRLGGDRPIERFTPGGVLLASGQELAADIVVLATGLTVELFGGMRLSVDGRPFDAPAAMAYKGMMLSRPAERRR
jgi:monooxygenase